MQRSVWTNLGSLSSYMIGRDTYDQDKLGYGPLIRQNNGATNEDDFAGPFPITVLRPMEASVAIPGIYPWAMRWTQEIDWEFYADNAAVAATRRILYATYNRTTGVRTYQGFVTLTYPVATNHTIRALRMTYDTYTVGTASVAGTAVTGIGTTWVTDRMCIGSRIGFGTTAPSAVGTWYEIGAIPGETSIQLTASGGVISAGPYVIEDLRCVTVNTNATAANGGVFVTKGLRPELFSSVGTTIPAAVSTDNIRAVYWLADAATVLNTVALGAGLEDKTSWVSQNLWVLDTVANPILYKYNIRKALTLASGKDTTAFVLKTGAGGALTGTASQANNGRLAMTNHGPGSGQNCMYFTTTTRVYRTVPLTGILSGSTTWIADSMNELTPGTANTYPLTSTMNSIEYSSVLDTFVIPTSNNRMYVTQYRTDGSQFDRMMLINTTQTDVGSISSGTTPFPSYNAAAFSAWVEGGLLYLARIGTTAAINQLFTIPLGADWAYVGQADNVNRLISPRMALTDIDKFVAAKVTCAEILGTSDSHHLQMTPEPFRAYYRTTGISDNSGAWTALDQTLSMSGVDGAPYAQLMLEFRVGYSMIPARIFRMGFDYEDLSTDSHYQLSMGESSLASKQFAWRHSTAFGSSGFALRVRLYDAVSGGLLVDDNTTTPTGTWERSTDGASYSAWTAEDKTNDTTYVRYTPLSLADSIKVRAVLTLN